MSRRIRIAFIVVVCAQLLFPLGVIGYNELKLATGDEVRLHVQPVDPVDFFRGEYIALTYDISRADVEWAAPGDTIYVPLRKEGDTWTGEAPTPFRPAQTFIRGQMTETRGISFGIETYYVEEGQALKYEQAMNSGDLFVDVVLDDDGGAKIRRLRIVGQD